MTDEIGILLNYESSPKTQTEKFCNPPYPVLKKPNV
jgi:hypothetical protein